MKILFGLGDMGVHVYKWEFTYFIDCLMDVISTLQFTAF